MKNTFKLSILLITTILILVACSNKSNSTSSSNKETITVENTYEFKDQKHTHSSGESKTQKVKVPVDPDRVAVLDYGALDIMQQMGLQGKIVSIAKGIGKIFKKEDKAKELNNKLSNKVKDTKEAINNDTVLFLNVDDKGVKAFGSTGRFGGFLNKDLGIQHADKNMKENSAGNTVTYEYLNKVNPDKLLVIDHTKNGDDKTLPSVLKNDVIKNMKAVKNNQIYQFETNAWYFSEGGINTTIEQLDKIEKAFEK